MDWYSWLSAARLDPAMAYEYALVFARNELEADDLAYFDHEFLHSMGVSVAKHRLEILKLARRSRRRAFLMSSRLLAAVDRVARYVRLLVHREQEESSALVLVPSQQLLPPDVDKTPKKTKSKPKTKEAAAAATATSKAPRSPLLAVVGAGGTGRAAATVHAVKDVDKGSAGGGNDDAGGEEGMVRWDRLFQDLKPN